MLKLAVKRQIRRCLNLASMLSMMSDLTAVKSTSTEIAVSQFGQQYAMQFHCVMLVDIPIIGIMRTCAKGLLQCGQSAMSFSIRLLWKLDIALENSGKQLQMDEVTA